MSQFLYSECQFWDRQWSITSLADYSCKNITCSLGSAPTAANNLLDMVVRTGSQTSFIMNTTAVFTCKDGGRLTDNYDSFSVEVNCSQSGVNPVVVGEPSTWPTCKTSRF